MMDDPEVDRRVEQALVRIGDAIPDSYKGDMEPDVGRVSEEQIIKAIDEMAEMIKRLDDHIGHMEY